MYIVFIYSYNSVIHTGGDIFISVKLSIMLHVICIYLSVLSAGKDFLALPECNPRWVSTRCGRIGKRISTLVPNDDYFPENVAVKGENYIKPRNSHNPHSGCRTGKHVCCTDNLTSGFYTSTDFKKS